MMLAPVSTAGSLQTTLATRRTADAEVEHRAQQLANINLATYLWQPWFAQANADIDVAYEKTFGDTPSSSFVGSGTGTLAVLPRSRYPVTLSLSHIDSRASGDFGSADFIVDRASLSARATISSSMRAGLNASWSRTDREDTGLLNSRNVTIDFGKTFPQEEAILGITSVAVTGSYRDSNFAADDPADDDRERQTMSLTLTTVSQPFENVTYNSFVSAVQDDIMDGADSFERRALQGVSTMQWRPDNRPFIVTGSLRTLTEDITEKDEDSTEETSTTLASGTLGLRWPISDRLSFNAGLRAFYQDVSRDAGAAEGEADLDEGTGLAGSFIAGVTYRSLDHSVGSFDWRWTANAQTENGYFTDDGFLSRETLSLGHRFQRPLSVFGEPLRFAFDQQATATADTNVSGSPFSAGLSHSLSFDYASAGQSSSTFARLFARDSRNVVGDTDEFQSLQFRYGKRVAFDRERRLQANTNVQLTRSVTEDDSDVFLTAGGEVTYTHRNFFEVENLFFRSELRLNVIDIDSLFQDVDDELNTEVFRNDWRNVLSYRIGRLTAELEASAFQRDTDIGYLLLARIRRDFGGVN